MYKYCRLMRFTGFYYSKTNKISKITRTVVWAISLLMLGEKTF